MTLEHIKDELAAAFHALSDRRDVTLFFNAPLLPERTAELEYHPEFQAVHVTLPKLETAEDVAALRGELDSFALKLRHHTPQVASSDSPAISGFVARMEQVRVELLGAARMTGVAQNLSTRWHRQLIEKQYDKPEHMADIPAAEILSLALFHHVTGMMPKAAGLAIGLLGPLITAKTGADVLLELAARAKNQQDYTAYTHQLARKIFAEANPATPDMNDEIAQVESHAEKSSAQEEEALPQAAQQSPAEGESVQDKEKSASSATPPQMSDEDGAAAEKDTQQANAAEQGGASANSNTPVYHAFTTQYDKIRNAAELAETEELLRHRATLDRKLAEVRDITARLAVRLQRKLLAEQLRQWDYHMEEGVLDPNKLTHVIMDAAYPQAFRWERESPYRDTVVTLLLDNSGSMRGRPIMMAAMCADILARVLERCGVKVEVLGFTTESWKGGKSRQQWLEQGSPKQPGRLNDLLHIIYKEASRPWRKTRLHLGLMLREGLLKENIDGEALAWAYQRLKARNEARKILMVISDGAPVDDATLAVNPADYLEKHLHDTVQQIEREHAVDVMAIGIGHNVSKHYKHAVTIPTVDALADAMVTQLVPLFDHRREKPNRRAKTL